MSMRKPFTPIRLATLTVAAGLVATSLSAPGNAEDAAAFSPRPQGGINGALLPSERSLWTYDAGTGKYTEVEGDASAPYTPNLRKPAKPLTFAFAEGWAAIPFSVADQQGHLQDRRGAGHRHHLLRPGIQAGEGGHLRRAAFAAEARFRHRLQLAVGRGGIDHEDLRRREDPGRQYRRVASERHLPRRRQLRLRPDRRQGGGRIREGAGQVRRGDDLQRHQPGRG